MTDLIVRAKNIITMDDAVSHAEAIAIDTTAGTITAVGAATDLQTQFPSAQLQDLGDRVIMPGFIEPHGHPAFSGMVTQEPATWIAPYVGYPTYAHVQQAWRDIDAKLPAGQPALFSGLDRLLQGAPELTNKDLDEFFPTRQAIVLDNSGHEAYFNSAVIKANGWADDKPPADPAGSRFGRNPDGTSNGRAYETAAMLAAAGRLLAEAVPHPLLSMARWYQTMSSHGITMSSEHTYQTDLLPGYIACSSVPAALMRVGLYHMAIEEDCGQKITSPAPTSMLWKQGIKLWADGTPWVGTIAASFPYLDTEVVRKAEIPLGPSGETMLNYSRAELDQILDKYAAEGWQFAFHVNGDVGVDVVLDAYERALSTHGLIGTDHRWRIEHCGGARGDQFKRAAALGVTVSLSPFQFIYWGDLLDGQMFAPEIGSQWVRGREAFDSGAVISFHNDGSVSPPIPLLNVQAMVTRRSDSGAQHGVEQAVTVHEAFKAHTINAAYQLRREHDLGSISVGKLADLVELSEDPYLVDPEELTAKVSVLGTWINGKRTDTDQFLTQIGAIDPSSHPDVSAKVIDKKCC